MTKAAAVTVLVSCILFSLRGRLQVGRRAVTSWQVPMQNSLNPQLTWQRVWGLPVWWNWVTVLFSDSKIHQDIINNYWPVWLLPSSLPKYMWCIPPTWRPRGTCFKWLPRHGMRLEEDSQQEFIYIQIFNKIHGWWQTALKRAITSTVGQIGMVCHLFMRFINPPCKH